MINPFFSDDYVEMLVAGPFPGHPDPWAEDPHYFQQIHADMIGHIVQQIHPQLVRMGYTIGREASLQIAEGRQPDIFIQRAVNPYRVNPAWDYALAAEEILAEPGEVESSPIALQALHIRQTGSGRLITIVELISPGNKARPAAITDYRTRRDRLLIDQGVNIVEIDITRSRRRLISDTIDTDHAYHIAIYLPGQSPRLVRMMYGATLKRMALPLRESVLPVELQNAFAYSYRNNTIAAQMRDNDHYTAERLPFPTLLTDTQREAALAAVAAWQAQLRTLASAT